MPVRGISVKKEILGVVEEFAYASSLHGVKYTFKRNSSMKDRVAWAVALVGCAAVAVGVGNYLWNHYRAAPTAIDVRTTQQPLHTVPFPSVTVCAGTRVKLPIARKILARYLPASLEQKTKDLLMLQMMRALSLLQFPNYNLMKPYLRAPEMKQMINFFMNLNITDFMVQVMPTCEEIFDSCRWHGVSVNCCEIFLLQRTEEGFCWSFNSLTAEDTCHCPLSEVLENEGVVEEDNTPRPECQLRRTTGFNAGSGLKMALKPSVPADDIGPQAQRNYEGVSVLTHTSTEYPHAGSGVFAPNMRGARVRISVSAEITMSSDSIRSLPIEERRCVFPDELQLRLHHIYTETTCLAECRVKHIMLMCRCKLYFFKLTDFRVPDCGPMHLYCITKQADKMRFYKPPKRTPGITDRELMDSLSCECFPTCYDYAYDFHVQRYMPPEETSSRNDTPFAHVDIYYGKGGFTRYQRRIVFEFMDLIVSLGGVANLFLGFSLLSLVEAMFWMYKLLVAFIKTNKTRHNLTKVYPIEYRE